MSIEVPDPPSGETPSEDAIHGRSVEDGLAGTATVEHAAQVLVIIDDEGRLGDVAELLAASGLLVRALSDPYLANGIATPGHPFDVILLDVLLPVRDVYRLCRQLRSSGRVPLVITTWDDRTDLDAVPGDRVVPHSSSAAELAADVLAVVTSEQRRAGIRN